MKQFLLILLFLSVGLQKVFSQEIQATDSTFLRLGSSENIETFQMADSTHSPRLATLYSAILPGMGQFYNEKYWKIPIIYALGFFGASQIKSNHQNYMLFRNVLFNIVDGNDANDAEIQDFIALRGSERSYYDRRVERFKRDRDYWIILTGLFYVLNIVDATVDAHLREFSINENLSMKITPNFQQSGFNNMHAGLSLNFNIK